MASGQFFGGIASGFQRQEQINNAANYQQGLLKLEQQRLQQEQQRQLLKQVEDNKAAVIDFVQKNIDAHKAVGDLNPKQIYGGISGTVDSMASQLDKVDPSGNSSRLFKSQVVGMLASPSPAAVESVMSRAKEGPLAIEEKKARIDYLRAGTPKPYGQQTSNVNPDLGNDSIPTVGDRFGRFAQSSPTSVTDVGADVGEQAGQDYLKRSVTPQDRDLVSSIANYDTDPQTAASGRVPRGMERSVRQQLIEQAMAYAKAKGEEYKPRAFKVVQDFIGNGKHGDQVRSLNVITEHMGTLRQLGDALDNGDIRAFNAIAQRWATEFGKSAPTNFQAAKDIVGTELIKALGVAGAGSAEERAQLDRRLSVASSPSQIQDAINEVYGPLLTGQLKGLRNQYLSAGGPRERFDKALLPGTRDFIDRASSEKKKGNGEWSVERID